jgi:hypothetical protein
MVRNVKKVPAIQQPSDPSMGDWQAKDDARRLMDAEEIRADKKRHGAAMKHVAKQHAATKAVLAGGPAARAFMGGKADEQEEE